MKNIVLVGFMGTGKTIVAKSVSKALKKKYVSTDDLIIKKENRAINDIFAREGEKYFRKIEKQIIKEVSLEENQVIDAGGGVVLDEENLENLKKNGLVICLWASEEEIYKRTKQYSHRPLLNVEDPVEKIRELLLYRKPFYEKADFHIDTTGLRLEDVVEKIKEIAVEKEA